MTPTKNLDYFTIGHITTKKPLQNLIKYRDYKVLINKKTKIHLPYLNSKLTKIAT